MPKYLKKLKTTALNRSLSLSKAAVKVGTKAAGHTLKKYTGLDIEEGKQLLWEKQADIIVKELSQLKGAAMKVGQTIAVFGDSFLPRPIVDKFAQLQEDSIQLKWPQIEKCLKRRLGSEKLAELEVEKEAFAAASIGQVHKAVIKETGEVICLKVQYPGVEAAIDSDINTIKKIFQVMKVLPIDSSQFDEVIGEVRSMLRKEVDYLAEKKMTDFYREAFKDDKRVKVPKTYERYTTKKILATEFCEGVSLQDPSVKEISQERKDNLCQALLDVYFYELYELRVLQTDTHFGNFKFNVDKGQDQLVLLDFGACKKYTKSFVEAIKMSQNGVWQNDRVMVEKALWKCDFLRDTDSRDIIDSFVDLVFMHFGFYCEPDSEYYEDYAFDDNGKFLFSKSKMIENGREKGLSLALKIKLRPAPKEFIFFGRKSLGLYGIVSDIGGAIDLNAIMLKMFGEKPSC